MRVPGAQISGKAQSTRCIIKGMLWLITYRTCSPKLTYSGCWPPKTPRRRPTFRTRKAAAKPSQINAQLHCSSVLHALACKTRLNNIDSFSGACMCRAGRVQVARQPAPPVEWLVTTRATRDLVGAIRLAGDHAPSCWHAAEGGCVQGLRQNPSGTDSSGGERAEEVGARQGHVVCIKPVKGNCARHSCGASSRRRHLHYCAGLRSTHGQTRRQR